MAITRVGESASVTATNPVVTLPANLQQGDLLLVVCRLTSAATAGPIMPGPWTRIVDQAQGTAPTFRISVWWALYGSSSMPLTINSQTVSGTAYMIAYRGAGGVDDAPTVALGSATTTITFPSATPLHVNDMCVFIWVAGANGSNGALSGTDPAPTIEFDSGLILGGYADGTRSVVTLTGARTSTFGASTTSAGATILLFESPELSTTSVIDLPPNQRWV